MSQSSEAVGGPGGCLLRGCGCLATLVATLMFFFAWSSHTQALYKESELQRLSRPMTRDLASVSIGEEVRLQGKFVGTPLRHQLMSGFEVPCLAWRRVVSETSQSEARRLFLNPAPERLVEGAGVRSTSEQRGGAETLVLDVSGTSVNLPLKNWNPASFHTSRAGRSPIMELRDPPTPAPAPDSLIQEAFLKADEGYLVVGKVTSREGQRWVLGPSEVRSGSSELVVSPLALKAESERGRAMEAVGMAFSLLALAWFLNYVRRRGLSVSFQDQRLDWR